ncbi:heavy metal translocating P-type ATPase [Tissierella sp. Yu-01]|uniref:heavy metal translocating P-type ATPase n=1 Tax=Tissierella sp. Yu-01 TaxID=3035694 RepID=UPI003218E6E2
MISAVKKELILEGLDCANCSAKIEHEVNEIDGVSASINFMTKTLTLETSSDYDHKNLVEKVTSIVHKHEPDVRVLDKFKNNRLRKEFTLEGLGCASCAAKIETKINELNGVESASIDFMAKKLTIEIENRLKANEIISESKKIVNKIEPDVQVISLEEHSHSHDDGHSHDHNHGGQSEVKEQIIKILISGGLLILGSLLETTSLFNLLIFLMSYAVVGGEVLSRAVKNIRRGQIFDENFLMSIATVGAFFVGEYAEAVGVMLFYQVGELFQDIAVDKSRRSISALMDIRPDYANLIIDNDIKVVSPEDVNIGDIIVVKPGEKIPLDGKVIEGRSMVDTSALTGESVPRELEPGSDALSGFINNNGVLNIEVTKNFGESTVSKILDLVQNASSKKAPTENFITKFARYYTPAVVYGALALAIIPPFIIEGATFSEWIYRALIFLVISCPCALVISIPLGFFGGIGGASKRGVLVKGSNYLEALNHVETVVFDKTGTLTKGVFNVTEIQPESNFTEEELIEIAAFAESYSNHPIAKSVLKAYGKEVNKSLIESYDEIPGHGIRVVVESKEILAGNNKLMNKEDISYENVETIGTVIHVALDKDYVGYIIISDEIKEDSARAIKALNDLGIKKTVMLTGDTRLVGEKVGKELGLDEVYTELLPTDKVEKLEELFNQKSQKGKLVFVGDGINDAPVLARADIGIAMGGLGSDAAIEAADIVIMTDEPSKIAEAIKISNRTKKIVWQNIAFALGIKGIFLIMGAFGVATMWEAVFADVGVAVIAILNSMRVMK